MDATKIKKTFCVITSLQPERVFGMTSDMEIVVMRANAEGLQGVQEGDFVYFGVKPFFGRIPNNPELRANWFGSWPRIIARSNGDLGFKPRLRSASPDDPDWENVFSAEPVTHSGQE